MNNIKNFKNLKVFFIGIGGISMSALAMFCEKFGAVVCGSDVCENSEVKKLKKLGIEIYIGHDDTHITESLDFVVFSGAIDTSNLELKKAKQLNIKCYERSEFLGIICKLYLNSIVVAGTHGKTTTTAMIGETFINANMHPSIHLGGESIAFGNYVIGNHDMFITEGCEYKNSIRFLQPNTSIITAIELDHTDCYSDICSIKEAFLNLANNTKQNVIVFENKDFSKEINSKVNVVNVGFDDDYDVCGKNLSKLQNGCYAFDVFYEGYKGRFQTNAVGIHNVKNALCAIAVALLYDIDISTIYSSLRKFKGVKRRFEKIGSLNGTPVICDYAHHPTEIVNSISTAKSIYGKVSVVFQPHTYSRTIGLKRDFLKAFKEVNQVAILKTYPAREKYMVGGSAKELYNELTHKNKTYLENRKSLKNYIISNKFKGCILILGAGDIYNMTQQVLKYL